MLLDAVRENNILRVKELLQSGEDACQVNGYNRTSLHKAAYYGSDPENFSSPDSLWRKCECS